MDDGGVCAKPSSVKPVSCGIGERRVLVKRNDYLMSADVHLASEVGKTDGTSTRPELKDSLWLGGSDRRDTSAMDFGPKDQTPRTWSPRISLSAASSSEDD